MKMRDPLLIRAARRVIGLMGACAPEWRRDELCREWLAELHAHAARLSARGPLTRMAQLKLLLRCCGALSFVIWSWKHEWGLDMSMQDVRYGLRMLRRRPAFTLVAVLTLALGVGATTAIFSAVYGILLRPLPYLSPERLVKLHGLDFHSETRRAGNLSVPDVVDFQRQVRSLEALGAHNYGGYFTVTGGGDAERVPRLLVTSGYFRALGARPSLGRLFTADEDRPSPPDVIVLSHGFWRRRFGGDPAVVGATVALSGNPATIVGVLPSDFVHPDPAIEAPPDIFALLDPDPDMSGRGGRYVRAIARLAPGVSLEQAEAELARVAASLAELYPGTNYQRSVAVEPLASAVSRDLRAPLLLLQGAACAVLLIVCTNLANLLLAAGTGRAGELAVRAALGASRARIVRQLLTEAVVLSVSGGVIGIALAFAAIHALSRAAVLPHIHRDSLGVDPLVLVAAALVSVGCGIAFGLLPALHIAGGAPRASASTRHTDGPVRSRLRSGLIAAEVGVSVVLLVASLLLLRSFWRLTGVDPGFDRRGVLSFSMALSLAKYPEGTQIGFYDRLYERLRALPGVEALGGVNILPLSGSYSCDGFQIAGSPVPEGQGPCAEARSASPGYFQAMGIPLVRGRMLTDRDTAASARVVVINEAMAREFFAGQDPVGRRLVYSSRQQNDAREIVGVVGNVHHFGMRQEPVPEFYVPQTQPPSYHGMSVVLRVDGRPADLVPQARSIARELEPDAPLYNIRTLEELIGRSVSDERLRTLLLASFAGLALLLAVIGTCGVLSITVAQRTQEMGIRLALGADRSDVVRLVVGQGLRPIAVGAALGLGLSVAVSRALTVFLFEVSASDPLTFAIVPAVIAAAGIAAVWIPARRACRVDPATVLRPQQ